MNMLSRHIIITISIILLLIALYVHIYEYEHISMLYDKGTDNESNIKKLLDAELSKILADGSGSTITKLEELIHLLQDHLKHHQSNNGSIIQQQISCPQPIPCPPVSICAPEPCPPPVSAENKPPYFTKLGPVNRKLDIGNPDTRDAWIKNKAETLCRLSSNFSIIDVSAGNKPYQNLWVRAGCKYYSNEFGGNVELVDNFRGESGQKSNLASKHDYIGTDITNTGAPSNSFDVAVLTEVLEHLPEPALAIPELVRVIKPGGHILITAPFTSGSHQLPYHFSSGYPREWYHYVAKKNNLEV